MTADPRPSPVGPEEKAERDFQIAVENFDRVVLERNDARLALERERDRSRGLEEALRRIAAFDDEPTDDRPSTIAHAALLAAVPREGERPERVSKSDVRLPAVDDVLDGNKGFAPVPVGEGADVPPWIIRVCEHGNQLVYSSVAGKHVHANTSPVEICNAPLETQRAARVKATS